MNSSIINSRDQRCKKKEVHHENNKVFREPVFESVPLCADCLVAIQSGVLSGNDAVHRTGNFPDPTQRRGCRLGSKHLRRDQPAGGLGRGNRGRGGAIFNRGRLNATDCTFQANLAQSITNRDSGDSAGGAVFVEQGTVTLDRCLFDGNKAAAALAADYYAERSNPAAPGSNGFGGAICNIGGTLAVNACTFRENSAQGGVGGYGLGGLFIPLSPGGPGGSGGLAKGGAIHNSSMAMVSASTFLGNRVTGGSGGDGGSGAGPNANSGSAGGGGGPGGDGLGAALFNQGVMRLANCTVVANACAGGLGGNGGNGGDGWDHGRGGDGGGGGTGGNGLGNLYGAFSMTNCTVAHNSGLAGAGGNGGAGGSVPGGPPYAYPGNPGSTGMVGIAKGGIMTSGSSLVNTLIATNAPGGNSSGTLTDLGHNLSSDASSNFTNVGSLNNTDPKLGPLADNGGPTLTMALLPGSPAIDAGDTSAAPITDQRGWPRPVGAAVDIGAYEYFTGPPVLRATLAQPGLVNVTVFATNDGACLLLASPDLMNWQCVATNQIGPYGTALFQNICDNGEAQRFYRATMP